MSIPTRRILDPIYGKPVIRYDHNGIGGWCKENSLTQWQKGGGWTANLNGGAQTNDDWAAVFVPVNEVKITDFNSAQWSYWMTSTLSYGVNIVFWVHDPANFNKRAEITQLGSVSGLGKTAGWNSHIFNTATTQMFWYGEQWVSGSAAALTGSGLDAGTRYTWAQFQADALFLGWTIYRISIESGWQSSGTFYDVWLAELKLNGHKILLKPSVGDHIGGEVKTYAKATVTDSGTAVALVTPAAAKRIRVISVNCTTDNAIPASFETYFGSGGTLWTDVTKAIFHTRLAAGSTQDKPGYPSDTIVFPKGSQPLGAIGEAVYMRTSMNITGGGTFVITYREE